MAIISPSLAGLFMNGAVSPKSPGWAAYFGFIRSFLAMFFFIMASCVGLML